MVASGVSRFLFAPIVAASLSACDHDCGTVRRTVANGTVRDAAGTVLGAATADLSDNLRPTFLRLSASIMGPAGSAGAPLRNHVTRARLETETGELLGEIPTGTSTLYVDAVVALNVDLASQQEYARVRSALLTNRAKLTIDTDLPEREHIETTLTDARDVPPVMGRCRIT